MSFTTTQFSNTMLILVIVFLSFLALLLIISVFKSFGNKHHARLERESKRLTAQIEQARQELSDLKSEIETNKIDRKINLSKSQIKALDLYERSNIRIPADILEDLSVNNFRSEQSIINFIENQRNYWKLENTKKPFKG